MPFLLQAFQTLKKRCSTNISTGLTMCLISLIVPVRGFVCAIVCVCTFCVCMCFKCVCVCFVFVCVSVDILLWLSLGLMTRQVGLSQAGESTRISSGAAEEHRCTFPLFTTLKKCQRGHLEMYIKTSKWANSRANEKKIWLSLLMFYHQFQIQTMVSSYG